MNRLLLNGSTPTDAELLAKIQYVPQLGQLAIVGPQTILATATVPAGAVQTIGLWDLLNNLVQGRTFLQLQQVIPWLTLDDVKAARLWARKFGSLGAVESGNIMEQSE